MKVRELRGALQMLDDELDVVTMGRFGEIDETLEGVEAGDLYIQFEGRGGTRRVAVLSGISSSYASPD